ncbi:MAG: translocation/assembly module TamB domain-containing protein [Deltaproteobacteria bacterium]|nr:translocation/assembly module TamB domain-containing protein [Deltaproteobacteria bacterium]MDQ3298830.1 translocation/assembly module TamB domain-containing protein [Myxococcota bacterium]
MSTDHRGRRKAWRWGKRIGLGLLSFIVLVVAAVLVVMHTGWGRSVMRKQVEARMNAMFTGGASIGSLEGSPLGELVMRDVVINGPDGKPAITIKRLRLDLGVLALVSKQARLKGVHAEDVDVDLRRDPDGTLQISRLVKPGPKSGWALQIPDIQVKRGHVRYDSGTEIMNFDDISIAGDAYMPTGEPLEANLLVHGRWRERGEAIWLDAVVRNDWEMLSVPSLIARVGDVSVVAAGFRMVKPQPVGFLRTQPRPVQLSGIVAVGATKAAVAKLVPDVELPADLELAVTVGPSSLHARHHVTVVGTVDGEQVVAEVDTDLGGRRASGFLATGVLDVTKLSGGKLEGTAATFITFDGSPGERGALPSGTAIIHASGKLAGTPNAHATIALNSRGERASTAIAVTGTGVSARISAQIKKLGDVITLERSTVVASVRDPSRVTGGKAPVHGSLEVNLSAAGALAPRPDLAIEGRVVGNRLRAKDLSIRSLKFGIAAKHIPDRPTGRVQLEARDVRQKDMFLRELELNAANRADGKIVVAMRSKPREAPWLVEADAIVDPSGPGDVVVVDLQRHRVRAGNGAEWTGTTGQIAIGPERIDVSNLTSASKDGKLAVAGHYHRVGRETGDLKAKIDLEAFALDNLDEGYAGTLDAHVDLSRTNGRLAGTAELDAKGIALRPKGLPFDAEARLVAGPDKFAVDARASSPQLGTATFAVDIDAPKDVTNVEGWKHMHRDTIRSGRITLQKLDVARLAQLANRPGRYRGTIDGDIQISRQSTGGLIQIRDLMAPALSSVGPLSANLNITQTGPEELTPTLVATIDDRQASGKPVAKPLAKIDARATLAMPGHLFDPDAWKKLGRGALKGAAMRIDDVLIEPALLDRLQVTTNFRGRASMVAEIAEAARSAKVGVSVRDLRGSPVSQPVAVDFKAAIDNAATTATMTMHSMPGRVANRATSGVVVTKAVKLLDVDARIPLTMAELEADPQAALAKRIKITAKLPNVPAPLVMGVFGRTEIVAGTLSGTIDVAGTVGDPTVRARLAGAGLAVPPGPRSRPIKVIKRITLDASWDGAIGKVEIDGTQDRGTIHMLATGTPRALDAATVSLEAKQFDLEPLLAFAPGPAGGAAGRLDANVKVTGLDPQTAKIDGELHLRDARLPIAPQVGTLQRAKIDVVVGDSKVKIDVDGRLGAGSVSAVATLGLRGATPTGGELTMKLRKVSPIGAIEPRVSADVTAKLSKTDEAWVADVDVRKGVIKVPSGRGEQLKPIGAPSDMRFITGGKKVTEQPMERRRPDRPAFIARLRLHSTFIESEEIRGLIKGSVELTSDAEAIGIVGKIEADRGNLDLFGRRYQLDRAVVRFDGSTDPLLDVQITHDFPEVTTITQVRGRASKPELIMRSDPGTYSQGQLLGFLLGGEPDGQPADGNPRDKATAAGASFIANQIGGYVKDALPVDLDVLRYEAATSDSGAAITVGTWITRSLFVAYRRRIDAGPDENAGEGEVEYWLKKRIVVEGVIGDRGFNGVDLLWRKRY